MGSLLSCFRGVIELDGGTKVTQGAQLAEGGFSFVYVATDARGRRRALKRIRCQSTEQIKAAQWELTVHRELTASGHPNLLPLADWGMRAEPRGEHFYFLTPLARRGSLRDEINRRVLAGSAPHWDTAALLELFAGVCAGLRVLHEPQRRRGGSSEEWAHRDLKPENVLLSDAAGPHGSNHAGNHSGSSSAGSGAGGGGPVPQLMDFGSVAKARVAVRTRQQALLLQEAAAEHSTMPYRAPELFDVPSHADVDERTDVWSLGCLLFAMMYGYSPFECEFSSAVSAAPGAGAGGAVPPPPPAGEGGGFGSGSSGSSGGGGRSGAAAASVTVVECGYLRVIGRVPEPPAAVRRHPRSVDAFVARLLVQDPQRRPTVAEAIDEAQRLAANAAGQQRQEHQHQHQHQHHQHHHHQQQQQQQLTSPQQHAAAPPIPPPPPDGSMDGSGGGFADFDTAWSESG